MSKIVLIFLVITIVLIFFPSIRKSIGFLLIFIGTLATLTVIGALVGIPLIIVGILLLFTGNSFSSIKFAKQRNPEYDYEINNIETTNVQKSSNVRELTGILCPNCRNSIDMQTHQCPYCEITINKCRECGAATSESMVSCPVCNVSL